MIWYDEASSGSEVRAAWDFLAARAKETTLKHISQLTPARRAAADQATREALLAIVVAQGKPVTIPLDTLNTISEQYRLVIEIDPIKGAATLTAEKFKPKLVS